ncbi:hypothetical protein CO2235_100062 [Cupriavidus oxalaticus]|uniref:Uncharacterized protein n=1 Tax=Cupriavidus oxalaticus TaxID=96344 RepID=A0A976B9I7_9BURK|nr:hypothetical protein CO2235_100062 [Cupriavidus oxalaticus]
MLSGWAESAAQARRQGSGEMIWLACPYSGEARAGSIRIASPYARVPARAMPRSRFV